MYHDQVLTPIKTIFETPINITMGLPLRVTPDHGPNEKMIGKNISNQLVDKISKFLDKND